MKNHPLDYAMAGAAVALLCVFVSVMIKPGVVDTDAFARALIGFPALVGSFAGMVAAGIVYFSGQ